MDYGVVKVMLNLLNIHAIKLQLYIHKLSVINIWITNFHLEQSLHWGFKKNLLAGCVYILAFNTWMVAICQFFCYFLCDMNMLYC